ncbi:hypothetical protein AB1484_35600 [Parafrankia sp. FMc6]
MLGAVEPSQQATGTGRADAGFGHGSPTATLTGVFGHWTRRIGQSLAVRAHEPSSQRTTGAPPLPLLPPLPPLVPPPPPFPESPPPSDGPPVGWSPGGQPGRGSASNGRPRLGQTTVPPQFPPGAAVEPVPRPAPQDGLDVGPAVPPGVGVSPGSAVSPGVAGGQPRRRGAAPPAAHEGEVVGVPGAVVGLSPPDPAPPGAVVPAGVPAGAS